jgi:hypothetical protein
VEFKGSTIDVDWEGDSVVESDILVLLSSAEFSVRNLSHGLDVLLTVTFSSWFLLHSLFEIVKVGNGVLSKVDSFDVD